jgi:hypothetical protein
VSGRVAEVAAILAVATILTVVMAWPVLRAPSDRIFGMEIVGRHHDPFTVMAQFEHPLSHGMFVQPVTDVPGALIARVAGPVAAYNWLVLLTFPLSAGFAYLLARHLALTRAAAAVAALVFAFSPFHLAQAAYHPHIAQTQWLPFYLLALWRCVDRPTPWAIALLVAATATVTLSNFYAGFIAAVLTPVALIAYWLAGVRTHPRPLRRLALTAGSLVAIAAMGLAFVSYTAGEVLTNRQAFAFSKAELTAYSAKWWSFFVPPVEHPLVGRSIMRFWYDAGVREGLLEQQLSLGWGIVALAVVAIAWWLVRGRGESRPYVPVLVVVASAALLCSLSPEQTFGALTFARPSGWLYELAPMFRAYARFGNVVQLMAALLAGMGVAVLLSSKRRGARVLCALLLSLGVAEYAVSPSALSRDVLPTTAHRWVMDQPGPMQVLDCVPDSLPSVSVPFLTGQRVRLLGGSFSDCGEPEVAPKLAAEGFTHLLVRRGSNDAAGFVAERVPDGLQVVARLKDGQVFKITSAVPVIYTAAMTGFFPREREGDQSWRWMGAEAAWTVVNMNAEPIVATLNLELSAFHHERPLELRLDGRPVSSIQVECARRVYNAGPFTIPSGTHQIVFHATQGPTIAAGVVTNGDTRPLSFALSTWSWNVRSELP